MKYTFLQWLRTLPDGFRTIWRVVKGIIFAFLLVLPCGCRNGSFIEGTSTTIGLYVPTGEGLVGLQCLEYLNGCKVNAMTNQPFRITREHSSTNSYFGIVHTFERTKTEVEVK